MSRLAALKSATSLSDLSIILGYKPKVLSYILYKLPADKKYTTFDIPKRSGGVRTIKAPVDRLKRLQRKLADLLQDCLDEIAREKELKDRTAHGFKRGRSIITNARQHRHRLWVFNIDLEDFFPTINFGRIRGFLIKNRDFALHQDVATVIAQIACHDHTLPQGSPCSPVISNLVAHLLDMRLVKLARSVGCTYSRYADDLSFSTNKREFPAKIAVPSGDEGAYHLWRPGNALLNVITRTGFAINAKKTHFMYRTSRQEVTGLVVNEKINVRCEYRHNVRAMVDRLVTTGEFEIFGAVHKDGHVVMEKRPGTRNELHGMLGFIDGIDVYNASHTDDKPPADEFSSRELVYREFLMYTTFWAPLLPVIVCEGDTDNVYLTHAIRSLVNEFPELAEVKDKKAVELKVRIYKYPKSSTARLLDLKAGGTGGLKNFLVAYRAETHHFGPGLSEPVIVVYDNDDGGKTVRNAIKGTFRVQCAGSEPFVHVFKNMYVVPTPFGPNQAPSKIEDFFDDAVKQTKLNGKAFNASNRLETDTEYGKKAFAHSVVKPRADVIDFGAFRPLLANIVAAIKHHRAAVTAPPTRATP
jgi:RNA-directed DNA polymerase